MCLSILLETTFYFNESFVVVKCVARLNNEVHLIELASHSMSTMQWTQTGCVYDVVGESKNSDEDAHVNSRQRNVWTNPQ
jgi:hypothetical protein